MNRNMVRKMKKKLRMSMVNSMMKRMKKRRKRNRMANLEKEFKGMNLMMKGNLLKREDEAFFLNNLWVFKQYLVFDN